MNEYFLQQMNQYELYEIAEFGIRERIMLRLEGKQKDHPQFLYDEIEKLEEMDVEELRKTIRIHAELFQLEKLSKWISHS